MTKAKTIELEPPVETIEEPVKKQEKAVKKPVETKLVSEEVKPKKGRPKKVKNYNEKGELLTKSGAVDKRVEIIKKNRQKSALTQALEQAKLIKKQRNDDAMSKLLENVDESSDSEIEFEISEAQIQPVKKVETVVEKVVDWEVVNKLKTENEMLKSSIKTTKHLDRLGILSRKLSIKI